jgi:hypothetical protein
MGERNRMQETAKRSVRVYQHDGHPDVASQYSQGYFGETWDSATDDEMQERAVDTVKGLASAIGWPAADVTVEWADENTVVAEFDIPATDDDSDDAWTACCVVVRDDV